MVSKYAHMCIGMGKVIQKLFCVWGLFIVSMAELTCGMTYETILSIVYSARTWQLVYKLRWPGIEPGSTAWKAAMLTIIPPTPLVARCGIKMIRCGVE